MSAKEYPDACAGWKRYKGLRRPICNDEWGCHKCWGIYNARRYAKKKEFARHWDEIKEECPDWIEDVWKEWGDEDEQEMQEGSLQELCWNFFMRGLELKLGPAPK